MTNRPLKEIYTIIYLEGNKDEEGPSERYIRAKDIVSCDDEQGKEMEEKQD